jgi:hypothetical protein
MLSVQHLLVRAVILFLSAISTALTPIRVAWRHIPVGMNQVIRTRRWR